MTGFRYHWFLAALLLGTTVSAQTHTFDRGYRPGHVYTSSATIHTDISMGIPGGMNLMKGTSVQELEFVTTSGDRNQDGTFDIRMRFEKGHADFDMRGMKQEQDLTDQLKALRITATCNENGIVESVDVSGAASDDVLKQLGPQLLKENQVRYPDSLSVGETFTQASPLDIPLQGVGTISGTVHSTFTLVSVEGDLATFEVTQDIGLAQGDDESGSTKLTGSGNGRVVYSFRDRFERSASQTTSMEASVRTAGSAFTVKVDTRLEQSNTVAPD